MLVKVLILSTVFVSGILADWSVGSIPDTRQVTEMKVTTSDNIPAVTFAKEELILLNPLAEARFKGFFVTLSEVIYKINQESGTKNFKVDNFMEATSDFSVKQCSVSYPGNAEVSLNKSFLPAFMLIPKDDKVETDINDTQVTFVLRSGGKITVDAFPSFWRGDNKEVDQKCLIIDCKGIESLESEGKGSVTEIIGKSGGEAAVRYVCWVGRFPPEFNSQDTDSKEVKAEKENLRDAASIWLRFQPGIPSYPRQLLNWLKSFAPLTVADNA